ncbi:uncharacterized protein [Watersipora subatra]|uniref:uncharacterized protein n=1 Tax=Watersipora subatra TaxID=2589382 RepID=UPI00355B79EA
MSNKKIFFAGGGVFLLCMVWYSRPLSRRIVPQAIQSIPSVNAYQGEQRETAVSQPSPTKAAKGKSIELTTTPTAIQVAYRDLSGCPPKPTYLPEYRAHCWGICLAGKNCSEPVGMKDINSARAKIYCAPNLNLIGIRKSGTSDFCSIWMRGIASVVREHQDYWPSTTACPTEYFTKTAMAIPKKLNGNFFNGGPGVLLTNSKVNKNATHLKVVSAMQFLGYMATPATRFYLQLRNPTDRAISYLFHWQKKEKIRQFRDMPTSEFTSEFVDNLLRKLLNDLQKCLTVNGEVACIFLPDSHPGDLGSLLTHSLYVVFLEEAFKFVPSEQVLVKTMEEYSNDRVDVVTDVIKNFFGVEILSEVFEARENGQVINKGKKNPVWRSTLEMLDNFFAPYNRRLSELLGDEKWLFTKSREDELCNSSCNAQLT